MTCPVCFESQLRRRRWREVWRCRACLTSIPERAYHAWMMRAVAASLPGRKPSQPR